MNNVGPLHLWTLGLVTTFLQSLENKTATLHGLHTATCLGSYTKTPPHCMLWRSPVHWHWASHSHTLVEHELLHAGNIRQAPAWQDRLYCLLSCGSNQILSPESLLSFSIHVDSFISYDCFLIIICTFYIFFWLISVISMSQLLESGRVGVQQEIGPKS